jgi:hypothetical protein
MARARGRRPAAARASDPVARRTWAAASARGVPVLDAPDPMVAGVLAAVNGEVGDGPGARRGFGDACPPWSAPTPSAIARR